MFELVYVVFKEGVYRHECGGVFITKEEAIRAAKELRDGENDNYHRYTVTAFPLNKKTPQDALTYIPTSGTISDYVTGDYVTGGHLNETACIFDSGSKSGEKIKEDRERLKEEHHGGRGELLVNAIKTPDGTYLESRHRHDCLIHVDKVTGETYMVDGGILNIVQATDMCVYTNDPHELIRDRFSWGNYGVDGGQPIKYVHLKDLTNRHIENILDMNLVDKVRKVMQDELQYREDNNIESPEEGSY